MLAVPSPHGQSDTAAGADVSAATPVRADRAPAASQRPAVPAELSARQLARLFILGYRAGSVGFRTRPSGLRQYGRHARLESQHRSLMNQVLMSGRASPFAGQNGPKKPDDGRPAC